MVSEGLAQLQIILRLGEGTACGVPPSFYLYAGLGNWAWEVRLGWQELLPAEPSCWPDL